MKTTLDQKNKIIKSFCVVGLSHDKLNTYNDNGRAFKYIKNMDILVKNTSITENQIIRKNEEWYRVFKTSNTWLRILFTNEYTKQYNYSITGLKLANKNSVSPITDFKIISCKFDDSGDFILLDKKHIKKKYFPIKLTIIEDKDQNNINKNEENEINILDEYKPTIEEDSNYVKIPKEYNLKECMNLPVKANAGVILISREHNKLPIKSIKIEHKDNKSFQFKITKHKSPFKLKYNPEVLDQYPQNVEYNNSVAMFCFPEGIDILEKKIEPKKFNFVLTDEIGERTYGSCLIFWEELTNDIRESMEPIYEEEEEINVEEKNEIKNEENNKEIKSKVFKLKKYYTPKALCILSKFPFFTNCSLFLKELYKITFSSSTKIPIERIICGFVDSLYKQSYNSLIRFQIRKENLDFYFIPNYGKDWDINDQYLETIFRVLSIDIISIAWQGLLLEKKLFLICSSKETLIQVAHSFITLLFPFKWIHTYIPILPEKLKAFIESPMPLIFGIPFKIDINELPDDGIIININKNRFEKFEEIPKLTGKLKAILEKKLKNLKENFRIQNPTDTDKWMDYLDEVEPKEIPENINVIDCGEIRDVFYDVFIQMFKNYKKYFNWNKDKEKEKNKEDNEDENSDEEEPIEFKRETFLKDHQSTDDGSFLSMFCDTALFNQFISSFSIKNQDRSTTFFFECINKTREKNRVYLPNIIPKKIIVAEGIKTDNLPKKENTYKCFPKLDPKLFIKSEVPIKPYRSKFIFLKDEWCYNSQKLEKKEWPRYLLYLIYEIWYNFFSFSIHFYDKNKSEGLMDYAIFLLEDLINNKKITPTRNLFSKMFKACGNNTLSNYIKKVLILANSAYKKSSSVLFQNAYLNGFYALTGNANSNFTITMSLNSSIFNIISTRQSILEDITNHNDEDFNFDNYIFLTENYCPYCTKNIQKIKFISMEELLAGFNKDINKLDSVCPNCLTVISCNIYYLHKNDKKLNIKKFRLMTPFKVTQEIDEINKKFGEYYFYLNNKLEDKRMVDLYLSIVFYFKLFDLPLFVLYIENDQKKFENIMKDIEDNIFRKSNTKKKSTRDGFFSDKNSRFKVSVSPDKKRRQKMDLSEDNTSISGIGAMGSDSLSMISERSNKSDISYYEKELWKDIILQNKDKIILTGDKIGTEDRNDLLNRIKYLKSVFGDISSHFVSSYKAKLEEYINERGFYNEIKEKETISTNSNTNTEITDLEKQKNNEVEKKNKIKKNRPQSVGRKYEAFNSDTYNKKNNINYYDNNAFDAIIRENRKDKSSDKKKESLPNGFNQINQLNDPNDTRSKGFGDTIKKFFSFKKKTKTGSNI